MNHSQANKSNRFDNKQDINLCDCDLDQWPPRPNIFGDLLKPVEAAQYLRLDETGSHSPKSAIRTLKYFRDKGELKATKFARHVWYRKAELDRFLVVKTEG